MKNSSVKSRKFLLAIMTLIACIVLVILEIIDGSIFATVISATVGAYMVGNVGEHWTNNRHNNYTNNNNNSTYRVPEGD